MAGRHTAAVAEHRQVGEQTSRARRGSQRTNLPMLRTSERSTLHRCEFLWHLTYERRLKPLSEAPALRFGSLVHTALAGWYVVGTKRGLHPAKGFKKAYYAEMRRNQEIFGMRVDEDERWVNAEELGIAMLNNYVEEYGQDPDWEVLATEMPFQCVVTMPKHHPAHPAYLEGRYRPVDWFTYTGIVDGVWKNRRTRELWIPDHKTTAGLGEGKLKYLQLDDQAGTYWSYGVDFLLSAGYLKKNQQLNGMMYNFLRKAMPDERASKFIGGRRQYLNLDGSVSKKQPSPYFLRQPIFRDQFDREEAKRRAQVDYRRIELFREGELELSKSPGMFTCPMCPMRDACELHETGNDMEGFIKQTAKTWDPYAEHEVYDGR